MNRLHRWFSSKESACQCRRRRRCAFKPWVEQIPSSRKGQPIPLFLPGKFHEQRCLVGYSPWGSQRDTTERLSVHTHPNRPESLYWEQLFLIKNCCFWSIGQREFWVPCLMAPDVCSSFFFSLKPLLANIPPSLSPLSFSKRFFFSFPLPWAELELPCHHDRIL